MKKIVYILICLSFVTCKEQKNEKKETVENAVEEEVRWLTFDGSAENSKHIVLVSGDEEYRSEEALPQLAKILSTHHGFKCTVLFAQYADKPGIVNSNNAANIPGLKALESADMMVIFTRFRALPDEQMIHIDNYLKAGKPVLGIRTATHAFNFSNDSISNYVHYSNNYSGDKKEWAGGFGRLVLGEKWINHHGHHKHQSTRGIIAQGADSNTITNGIESEDIWGATDVYGVRLPLPGDSQPIVLGQVINRSGDYNDNDVFFGMKPTDNEVAGTNEKGVDLNNPMMPIAWTKSYQIPNGTKGKAFTTTIGAANDLLIEGTRRLIVNGVFWAMDLPCPEKANVSLIGNYTPSAYGFQKDEYWIEKNLAIKQLK